MIDASTYVRVALECAGRMPDGVFSAGQVAFIAHQPQRVSDLEQSALDARRAFVESGRFRYVGNWYGVDKWRVA